MQSTIKHLITTFVMLCMCLIANGQATVNLPKDAKLQVSKPAILSNNGKLLSKKGVKSIYYSDITSIRVKNDTVYVSVKDSVLKRLDKDKGNYTTQIKNISKSTKN